MLGTASKATSVATSSVIPILIGVLRIRIHLLLSGPNEGSTKPPPDGVIKKMSSLPSVPFSVFSL